MIYWYNKKLITKLADTNGGRDVIVRVIENFEEPAAVGGELYVSKSDLVPMISELFVIGDQVASMATLTGRITGFELETNRAIVVSTKIGNYKDDRTRYAYLAKELTKLDNNYIFEPGKMYKINGKYEVMVCVDPKDEDVIHLYNKKGKPVYMDLSTRVNKAGLAFSHGIENVQQINNFK